MVLDLNLFMKLAILTVIIHIIDTLAYAVRLNSVKNGNFALNMSLFNLIVLISRTANMFQGPALGTLIDSSIKQNYNPITDIRYIVYATTIGTIIGICLIPTFLKGFSKAASKLEETGSVPSLVLQSLSLANIKRITRSAVSPKKSMVSNLRYKNIPKKLLIINMIITGIYAIGVLAAYYASTFYPDKRTAIVSSSGMINGIASILLTVFIDPKAAIITDEVYRGKRDYDDVKALVVMLIGSKLLGTLLGQVLLVPGAKFITLFYR